MDAKLSVCGRKKDYSFHNRLVQYVMVDPIDGQVRSQPGKPTKDSGDNVYSPWVTIVRRSHRRYLLLITLTVVDENFPKRYPLMGSNLGWYMTL